MSIVQVMGGAGRGGAADRTLFVGPRIPTEITSMTKPLAALDKQIFRQILPIVVSALEGNGVDNKIFKNLSSDALSEEVLSVIYGGLYTLIQCALRPPAKSIKQEIFREDLHELKIPKDFIPDIASVVYGSRRPTIDKHSLESRPRLPQLESFRWRVDVAISTSVLNRVLDPSIFIEMTLSNGKIHSFEMPVSKFHELRYNVAFVLKEMEDLETKNIFKIQD